MSSLGVPDLLKAHGGQLARLCPAGSTWPRSGSPNEDHLVINLVNIGVWTRWPTGRCRSACAPASQPNVHRPSDPSRRFLATSAAPCETWQPNALAHSGSLLIAHGLRRVMVRDFSLLAAEVTGVPAVCAPNTASSRYDLAVRFCGSQAVLARELLLVATVLGDEGLRAPAGL